MATPRPRAALLVVAVFAGVSAGIAAQKAAPATGLLAPFGVSEATIRTLLLNAVSGGGEVPARLVGLIDAGYQRIPVATRGPATTTAFIWAKNFVSSPEFAAIYARFRDEHTPAGAASTDSIDVAVQKQLAAMVAQLEESRKNLGMLDAVTRTKATKGIDDQIAQYKAPETTRQMRMVMEAERAGKNEGDAKAAAQFAAEWPADPRAYVKHQLQRFMTATANIDYSLAQIWVKDPTGKVAGFLSTGLEDISWETLHAIVAGKDAVDAARAFVGPWLKELP